MHIFFLQLKSKSNHSIIVSLLSLGANEDKDNAFYVRNNKSSRFNAPTVLSYKWDVETLVSDDEFMWNKSSTTHHHSPENNIKAIATAFAGKKTSWWFGTFYHLQKKMVNKKGHI